MILPCYYPISYQVEVQDQYTGFWQVIYEVPVRYQMKIVEERFLLIFTFRHKEAENYDKAIAQARRNACHWARNQPGIVRIREMRRNHDDNWPDYLIYRVWQKGRWLTDA